MLSETIFCDSELVFAGFEYLSEVRVDPGCGCLLCCFLSNIFLSYLFVNVLYALCIPDWLFAIFLYLENFLSNCNAGVPGSVVPRVGCF